jgi:hypothetical protein
MLAPPFTQGVVIMAGSPENRGTLEASASPPAAPERVAGHLSTGQHQLRRTALPLNLFSRIKWIVATAAVPIVLAFVPVIDLSVWLLRLACCALPNRISMMVPSTPTTGFEARCARRGVEHAAEPFRNLSPSSNSPFPKVKRAI